MGHYACDMRPDWFNNEDKQMATKKVVKKAVPKKDKYMYCDDGLYFTYDSVKDIEEEIKQDGYGDDTVLEIWKLVKKVRVKRTDITLEEIK